MPNNASRLERRANSDSTRALGRKSISEIVV